MSGSHIAMKQFATRLDFERAQAEHSGRQLVQYSELVATPAIGAGAFVVTLDHPDTYRVTSGLVAHTGPVQWYNEDTGVFETLNTRYVPATLVAPLTVEPLPGGMVEEKLPEVEAVAQRPKKRSKTPFPVDPAC
jgi:hypothetical protein